jgi:hypothetical protein
MTGLVTSVSLIAGVSGGGAGLASAVARQVPADPGQALAVHFVGITG